MIFVTCKLQIQGVVRLVEDVEGRLWMKVQVSGGGGEGMIGVLYLFAEVERKFCDIKNLEGVIISFQVSTAPWAWTTYFMDPYHYSLHL